MKRDKCLNTAADLVCNDREESHGAADRSFETIAGLWSITLGRPISVSQVAMMMMQLKQARIMTGKATDADHWVDICGYAALGCELVSEPVDKGDPDRRVKPDQVREQFVAGDGSIRERYVNWIED
jgi:hypothetical protein